MQSRKLTLRTHGVSLVETAGIAVVFIPLLVVIAFAIVEVSQAYGIREGLDQAARQASRDLAAAYAQSVRVATSRPLQDSMVYNKIRIYNVLNSSQQFETATFDTAADPPIVTVTVRYLSDQYGLPRFPNVDPLNLGSSLQINSTASYRLN